MRTDNIFVLLAKTMNHICSGHWFAGNNQYYWVIFSLIVFGVVVVWTLQRDVWSRWGSTDLVHYLLSLTQMLLGQWYVRGPEV